MALPHRWPLSVPSPSHGSTPCPAVKSLCLEAEKVRLCIYVSRHWVLNNKAVAWVDFLSLSVSWWAQNEQALVSAKDFLTAVKNPGPTGYHHHLSPASDLKGSSALCLASTKCIWWRWQKIAALICFCDTSRQCVIQALWHTTVGFLMSVHNVLRSLVALASLPWLYRELLRFTEALQRPCRGFTVWRALDCE